MASSNIRRALGRNLGLEDDTEAVVVDAVEAPVVGEETPAADTAVVEQAAAEVEQTNEVVEELEEAKEGLEAIALSLESISKNGGLDQNSAMFARHAIAGYTARFGIQTSDVMPSMESFGGASARASATTVTMEGIGEAIKSFWDAIVAQLKKVWAAVKNWWLKTLDAAPRLKAAAEKLKAKADKTTGSPKESKIDGPLKALHISGKAPADVLAQAKGLVALSKDSLKQGLGDKVDNAAKMLEDIDAKTDATKIAAKTTEMAGNADIISIAEAKTAPANAAKRFGEGLEILGTGELPGGKMIIVKLPAKKDDAGAFKRVGQSLVSFAEKAKDVDSNAQFAALSAGACSDVCDQVIAICDNIIDFKKEWEKRESSFDTFQKAGDKLVKTLQKDTDLKSDQRKPIVDLIGGAQALVGTAVRGPAQFISYYISTSKAYLTLVEKSLSNHKE